MKRWDVIRGVLGAALIAAPLQVASLLPAAAAEK
jgi:hypothetical protein